MAKSKTTAAGIATAILLANAAAQAAHATAFTPGDLVVTRAIGGNLDFTNPPAPGSIAPIASTAALAGSGVCATVELDEYTPSGNLVQSVILPNVQQTNTAAGSTYALTFSGTQNNEGTIEISGNGKYFTIVGYNQTAGTGGTITGGSNAAASTVVQRVVGLIGMDGSVNTTTGLTDVSSTVSVRSAYTTDGTNIWVGGSSGTGTAGTGGVHYATIGSTTSTQITLGNTNQRILSAFDFGSGPQLLISSNSGTTQVTGGTVFRGIATLGTGLPTTPDATPVTRNPVQLVGFSATGTGIPGTAQKSDNYWFKDANTVYIADQDVGALGGVQKWTFQDTNADSIPDTWVFNYNITFGAGVLNPTTGTQTAAVGGHGLAGEIDPITGNVDLFATTFDGAGANSTQLFEVIDNGTSFSDSVLATSAANSAFRGVAIVPGAVVQLLLGDANGDGKVDMSDLNIVLNNFGKTSALRTDGNFDGMATIDLTDLAAVLNNFGKGPAGGSASVAAAPEPASLALLGLGVAGILIRRRRA